MPIANPDEMDLPLDSMVARIKGHAIYAREFERLYPQGGVSATHVAAVLAAFQRTLIWSQSSYDRFMAGATKAMDESAQRGMALFNGKAKCATCHTPPLFTDHDFHNNGVVSDDPGRFREDRIGTAREFEPTPYPFLSTIGAFKTPSLRQAIFSAPYMHNGSLKSLADVIDFYNRGGDNQEKRSKDVVPLRLTDTEKSDLLSFVKALSDTMTHYGVSRVPSVALNP